MLEEGGVALLTDSAMRVDASMLEDAELPRLHTLARFTIFFSFFSVLSPELMKMWKKR
jgi:hypothetical protein